MDFAEGLWITLWDKGAVSAGSGTIGKCGGNIRRNAGVKAQFRVRCSILPEVREICHFFDLKSVVPNGKAGCLRLGTNRVQSVDDLKNDLWIKYPETHIMRFWSGEVFQ